MKLRPLNINDAELMLEWMHDHELVKDLHRNFEKLTIDDCKVFIKKANETIEDKHYAVAEDDETYVGTVSLKNIDKRLKCAELGIVMRRSSHGKGAAQYAVNEIIRIASEDFEINKVYWCVSVNNDRALRFYDKMGFERVDIMSYPEIMRHIEKVNQYTNEEVKNYVWYVSEKK